MIIQDPSHSYLNTYRGATYQQASSIVSLTNQQCYEFSSAPCYSEYGFEVSHAPMYATVFTIRSSADPEPDPRLLCPTCSTAPETTATSTGYPPTRSLGRTAEL